MSKSGFNNFAHNIREKLGQISEDAKLSMNTVIGVLQGKFERAVAHGEPCRIAVERACGGQEGYQNLSMHLRND